MLLSTRGQYGTRAMIELGLAHGGPPVLLRDIARRQDISLKYLERVMGRLRSAGLVRGIRGARGGYVLTRDPEEITLREIVEALEGTLMILPGCDGVKVLARDEPCGCAMGTAWRKTRDAILEALESTTLGDLVRDQLQMARRIQHRFQVELTT
jgi:Rrf2 family cysteine metabolism transcriptional repressor